MIQNAPVYDICTLSDFKQEDILISWLAPYLNRHKNLYAAHKHTFYHLVLFLEGTGSHTIDFERFHVQPFQIYFMVPGQVHSWAFEGVTDGYIINFSAAFFHSFLLKNSYIEDFGFFSGSLADAVIDLPASIHQHVKNLFEEIIAEWENNKAQGTDMVRILMLQLFILINRLSVVPDNKATDSYNRTVLKNFQKLIEANFINLKLPKDYAELLYITPNHLNAVCKDLLGMQAGEVIRNRLILEAKRLLTNPQLGIAEIAFSLNFSDNSYFTKFFKKLTGVTPEEFRKNILKKE